MYFMPRIEPQHVNNAIVMLIIILINLEDFGRKNQAGGRPPNKINARMHTFNIFSNGRHDMYIQ